METDSLLSSLGFGSDSVVQRISKDRRAGEEVKAA
jgi:hypothetical protein